MTSQNHHFVNTGVWGVHGVPQKIIGYEEGTMVFKSLVGYSHPEKFLRVYSLLHRIHKINSKRFLASSFMKLITLS